MKHRSTSAGLGIWITVTMITCADVAGMSSVEGATESRTRAGAALKDSAEQPDELFRKFEREVVEVNRQKYPRASDITPMEYKSERVKELLPGCRLFVGVGGPTSASGPYAYDETGKMWNLGGMQWAQEPGGQYYQSLPAFEFFSSRKFKLADDVQAISVARLLEELNSVWSVLTTLRNHSKNFTVYDPKAFRPWHLKEDYEHTTTREENAWKITSHPAGPPRMGGREQRRCGGSIGIQNRFS